ncbi:unnamed protein product [Lymnaea stagnalis]|uniref:U2A'/phosphoprotein 32 family A C-terminal domain-containing protein n=1 Tax=Lymnaea stagnalis TaxID=6523 RepID=A0AAV2HT04_LYMST
MASEELLSQIDNTVELTEKLVLLRTRAQDLESVKKLNCWASNIKDVSVVRRLPNLEVCSLSINKLTTLRDFAHCYNLQELYVRTNNIQCLGDIHYLKNLPKLRSLWLSENPCATKDNYRMTVLKTLPRLQKLDNVVVTEDELTRAKTEGDDVPIPEDFSYSSVFTDATSSSTEDDKEVDKSGLSESSNKWALPRRKRHQKKREDQIKERLSLDDGSIKSGDDGDVSATSKEDIKSDGDVSPRTFKEENKSEGDVSATGKEAIKSDGDVSPRTFKADIIFDGEVSAKTFQEDIKSDVDISARSEDCSAISEDANLKNEKKVLQVEKNLTIKSDVKSEHSKEENELENGHNNNDIHANEMGDKKDLKFCKEAIVGPDKDASEGTYGEAAFELPLKRCYGKTHLAITVPEVLQTLHLEGGGLDLDLTHDEAKPTPAAGIETMSIYPAPGGENINNSATESGTAFNENSLRVVSLLDRIQLDDVADSTDVVRSVDFSQDGRDGSSDQTVLTPEINHLDNATVTTLTQSGCGEMELTTLAAKEKTEPIDWEEYNRLRIQVGVKPMNKVTSTTKSINSDILRTRNSNILNAVLSLVKELDKDSLDIVSSAVKSRLDTFS